ncbi:MAG: hypothetical protein AAGA75_13975 [Cyanobacteria bacterium P01_E01_bin.6]
MTLRDTMSGSNPEAQKIRAIIRPDTDESGERILMPWETEGEFEIEALIISQKNGELLVKVPRGDREDYLTILGFLPGKVTRQRWKLLCVRASGQVELLDGEPLKS